MRLLHAVLPAALVLASAAPLHGQTTGTTAPAAQGQPMLRPMPSSRATAEVTLAYPRDQAPAGAQPVSIRIDYGQPHLRGRQLHTDSLVPYDTPWRTGANAATTLTTGVDLVLGGKTLPKGTYVLWTLPSRSGWTLMVQKGEAPGGSMQQAMRYDAANDVARVPLRMQTLAAPVESLSMWLVPSTAPGAARGELRMAWGTTLLSTDWSVR